MTSKVAEDHFKGIHAPQGKGAIERFFRQVVEQAADSVVITDREGVIEYVNPAFERLTGYSQEEVRGKTPRILKSGHQGPEFYEKLWNTIASGQAFRSVLLNRKKNGDLFYWEQIITPMKDAQGRITHFISTARDASSAMQAQQFKDEFVRMVSHEIRNPLAVVKEGLSLATEGLLGAFSPQGEEVFAALRRSVDRLHRMVSSLLDLSKMEAGKMPLALERVDVVEVAREVHKSFLPHAQEKGLALKTSFSKDRIEGYADRDKLFQIFTNLVANALRFTDCGTIEISVTQRATHVESSVADTGCGISPKDLPKLFGKFQQFRPLSDPNQKGTGLGLAICKSLVQLQGGAIDVRSRLGQGTVFTFTLPVYSAREAFQQAVKNLLRECQCQAVALSVLVYGFESSRREEAPTEADPIPRWVKELERKIKAEIVRETDVVLADEASLRIAASCASKEQARRVQERIDLFLRSFLESQGPGRLTFTEILTFPGDAQGEAEFLRRISELPERERRLPGKIAQALRVEEFDLSAGGADPAFFFKARDSPDGGLNGGAG